MKYLIFSLMSHDILTFLMFTMASKNTFSLGEQVLDNKYLLMSCNNLKMIVFFFNRICIISKIDNITIWEKIDYHLVKGMKNRNNVYLYIVNLTSKIF